MPVSGSTAAPPQFAPPPTRSAARSCRCTDGGVNSGPMREPLDGLDRQRAQFRREVDEIVDASRPEYSNGAGLVGNGCVGEARSPGTSDGGTGRSSIGQIGLPGHAVERVDEPLLGDLRKRLDAAVRRR